MTISDKTAIRPESSAMVKLKGRSFGTLGQLDELVARLMGLN